MDERRDTGPNQDDAGPTIGDLTAVITTQPTFDDGVVSAVGAAISQRADLPTAGLGVGIAPGVGEIQVGDGTQVLVVQAVAPVVLLGDLLEHVRPDEAGLICLVPDPRGRSQVVGRRVARNCLLEFGADHEGTVVVTGPQIGHRGQHGDAS